MSTDTDGVSVRHPETTAALNGSDTGSNHRRRHRTLMDSEAVCE